MIYQPDQWQLIKVNGTDPHYRVFGSWSGGYLDGDSWRLNSGIKSIEVDKNFTGPGTVYLLNGHSGSTYAVHSDNYGIRSLYNRGELERICDNDMAEILEKMPDMGLLLDDI